MSDTTTITPIPLAPKRIYVEGPARGRYNLMSSDESDRYIVRIDGVAHSAVIEIDRSDEIADLDWTDKISAIADEAKRWYGGAEANARRDALHEWINRDDPEDERLMAIEAAQLEHDAQAVVRSVRRLGRSTQSRVFELLQEALA